MTTQEAADEIGVGRQWITTLIQRGRLPAEKHGRDWFINPIDLQPLMDMQRGRPRKKRPGEGDYSAMTTDEFDTILVALIAKQTADALLTIPGIYEILAEEFNNEVLTEWDNHYRVKESD